MHIKINDRDVMPQNIAEAVLEREVRSIHFELNEAFDFSDAFEAMLEMGEALGEVHVGQSESDIVRQESENQMELDFSLGAHLAGSTLVDISEGDFVLPSEGKQFLTSSTAIEGDVAVSLAESTLNPCEGLEASDPLSEIEAPVKNLSKTSTKKLNSK